MEKSPIARKNLATVLRVAPGLRNLLEYFKKRVLDNAALHPGIKWFVVDGSPINSIDSTGAAMLEGLSEDLRERGIRLGFANLRTEVRAFLERSGVLEALGDGTLFASLKSAVDACHAGGFTETEPS